MSGSATYGPPCPPTFTRTKPLASSARSASRTVTRLTANWCAISRSVGRRSPGRYRPDKMALRIWAITSLDARVGRTGANTRWRLSYCRFANTHDPTIRATRLRAHRGHRRSRRPRALAQSRGDAVPRPDLEPQAPQAALGDRSGRRGDRLGTGGAHVV